MPAPITITTPPKRYKAAPRCIYCGRKGLRRYAEHIIPFGLAANSLVLPEASCKRCQDTTRDFETICLRQMWWPFRTHIGAPTRGKERPDEFLLRKIRIKSISDESVISYDQAGEHPVAPTDYPIFFYTEKFRPPGLLSGRPPEDDLNYEGFCLIDEASWRKFAPQDKDGFRLGPGAPEALCRMLAKIGHSYAVAELGFEVFQPCLTPFIRGVHINCLQWIGCDEQIPPTSVSLHEIGLETSLVRGRGALIVSLRLFACLGTPVYQMIVGELNGRLNSSNSEQNFATLLK